MAGKKLKKSSTRKINWSKYNQSLINRGDFMLFIDKNIVDSWYAATTDIKQRGGQIKYSDTAIETMLMLDHTFGLRLRSVTGFVGRIFKLAGIDLDVPNFSRLSRRGQNLQVKVRRSNSTEPIVVSIDSTGLKIYGQGEWNRKKHGKSSRRQWVKLHIVMSNNDMQILDFKASNSDVADCEVFDELISNIPTGSTVLGDGAYGDHHAYNTATDKDIYLIAKPKSSDVVTVASPTPGDMLRNLHVAKMKDKGFHAWANKVKYFRRNLAETTMDRFKRTFGGSIAARKVANQVNELAIKCKILNKFADLGMPEELKAC